MSQISDQAVMHDARQALVTCLSVEAGQAVTILYDRPRHHEALALREAALELGAKPLLVDVSAEVELMLADRNTFMPAPSAALVHAMVNSDACAWVTHIEWPLQLFFAVYEATAAAQAAGTLIGWVEQPLGSWDITEAEMERISDRVWTSYAALEGAKELHVTSPAGTDIRVSIEGRVPIRCTPIVRRGEIFAFIPYYGEVAYAPVETTGTGRIVLDGALMGTGVGPHEEWADEEARRIRTAPRTPSPEQPVVLELRDGVCVDVSGGREADEIRTLFAEVPDASRIAEVAFGTSERSTPGSSARLGTAHFAFGDNLMYGGEVKSPIHQNGVLLDASIQIVDDGTWILKEGEWQLPEGSSPAS